MTRHLPRFALRLARTGEEVRAAQALRHRVFVAEGGARGGDRSDPARGLEADRFDPFCEHLLLLDALTGEAVGTTRLMDGGGAARAGGFATEAEFDIAPLRASGRRLLEVGRTCLLPAHRGGAAMHRLWQGLAAVVEERGVGVLFGLASLPGTDAEALRGPLVCLAREHRAPEGLRPASRRAVAMDPEPGAAFDRRAAVLAMPALLKAYLRLGGTVGEGAFLDPDFGCLDLCVVLEADGIGARARAIYAAGPAGAPR